MDTNRLQVYELENFKIVINFATFQDAVDYANEKKGELVEVKFSDKADDNPVPDNFAQLIEKKIPFWVDISKEYTIIYSTDEAFQDYAEKVLIALKNKKNDIAPEDWLDDQNIAPGDRMIILKNGEINTVTTRERIKYLMLSTVYEIAVKIS